MSQPASAGPETQPTLNRRAARDALILAAVALLVGLWQLGDGPLTMTEGHRALTGHQMAESGQWLVPRLYGQVYLRKTPMQYWIIGTTEQISGTHGEWIWRLPSALGAMVLCLFLWAIGRRWFGPTAGLVSGFAFLGQVALWSQNRNADIDSLNTAAAIIAGLCLLEIGHGTTRRPWAWSLGATLAITMLMLLKGPVGMIVVLAVVIGSSVALRRGKWIARPWVWAPVVVGFAALLSWKWAVQSHLTTTGEWVADSGAKELLDRLIPTPEAVKNMARSVAIVAAVALPVSVVLLPRFRDAWSGHDEQAHRMSRALAGSFWAGLALCAAFLIAEERYGYIILPLLCPLAGAAGAAWGRGLLDEPTQTAGRQALTVAVALLVGVCVWAVIACWEPGQAPKALLVALPVGALAAAAVAMRWAVQRRIGRCAWVIGLALIPLATVAFIQIKVDERHRKSGREAGVAIGAHVGTTETPVLVGEMVRNHPEVFYYADLPVRRPPQQVDGKPLDHRDALAHTLTTAGPGWVVFDRDEWDAAVENYPGRFDRILDPVPGPDNLDRPVVAWFAGAKAKPAEPKP